jgi:hypothetical protein
LQDNFDTGAGKRALRDVKKTMIYADNLHDATLVTMCFDWESRRLRCELRVASGADLTKLVFEGVRSVHVPCFHPWGKSNSVNSVDQIKKGDLIEFSLEMQSGDVICILANRIVVNDL